MELYPEYHHLWGTLVILKSLVQGEGVKNNLSFGPVSTHKQNMVNPIHQICIGLILPNGKTCRFGHEFKENTRLETKTHQFQTHLKNSIFRIEDSIMDQTNDNYLTHMNLLLTHFCLNVTLDGCSS